jgi:hypothetical protein
MADISTPVFRPKHQQCSGVSPVYLMHLCNKEKGRNIGTVSVCDPAHRLFTLKRLLVLPGFPDMSLINGRSLSDEYGVGDPLSDFV